MGKPKSSEISNTATNKTGYDEWKDGSMLEAMDYSPDQSRQATEDFGNLMHSKEAQVINQPIATPAAHLHKEETRREVQHVTIAVLLVSHSADRVAPAAAGAHSQHQLGKSRECTSCNVSCNKAVNSKSAKSQ